jgi:hypothetical protein
MAKIGIKVDPGFQAPKDEFELITDGWYEAEVMDSEIKISAAGNEYLNLTYLITGAGDGGDPRFIERRVWQVLSIYHSKDSVRERALNDLVGIASAAGVEGFDDTDDITGSRLQIKVGTQRSKDPQYGDKNVVRAYQTSNQVAAVPPSAPAKPWAA